MTRESLKEKRLLGYCRNPKEINIKVVVKTMDIQWLLRGYLGFLDFAPILSCYRKENLFQTEFLRALTNEYWVYYQKKIII